MKIVGVSTANRDGCDGERCVARVGKSHILRRTGLASFDGPEIQTGWGKTNCRLSG